MLIAAATSCRRAALQSLLRGTASSNITTGSSVLLAAAASAARSYSRCSSRSNILSSVRSSPPSSSVLSRLLSASRPQFQSTLASSTPLSTSTSLQASSSSSSTESEGKQVPILPRPVVGRWLLFSSTLVFAVIVVGGITRLTESGLSIVEWRPVTGIIPPLTNEHWMEEFEKYKQTPEFKLLNHSITLDNFKSIYFWEWSHRVLGRVIGLTFVFPLLYFASKRAIPRNLTYTFSGLALLIGAQGALGWYMVKSGLEDKILNTPGAVPRVSQYRLAAHLGTALLLYAGMFWNGLAIIKDWRYAQPAGGAWSGLKESAEKMGEGVNRVLSDPRVRRFKKLSWGLAGLVFLTALSGAFVAGLDAGLLYNEFPLMGGRLIPPTTELFSASYSQSPTHADLWWRNVFENPTTTQFNHRVLATTTYLSTLALYLYSRTPAMRAALPPLTRMATAAAFGMANVQVLLGISTLLYLVPVPLAACHQAGSVALLTAMVHVLVTLRRPGAAARYWRQVRLAQQTHQAKK